MVIRGFHVPTNQTVAVKKVKKPSDCRHEIEIPIKLSHRNILKLLATLEDASFIYIILPYCTEDLFKLLRRKSSLSERRVAKYIFQVCDALAYMHQSSIMHRDIKPENLLINKAGDILIADFGFATLLKTSKECVGTPGYMAPEICSGARYTNKVDCWAVGVLTFELLTKSLPFGSERPRVQVINFTSSMSKDVIDFISTLLNFRPKDRPMMVDVIKDNWFLVMKRHIISEI